MSTVRKTGLDVTVCSLGGTSILATLKDVTLNIEIDSQEARAIADEWSYAWAVGRSWNMDFDLHADGSTVSSTLMAEVISGDCVVTVATTIGGLVYSGTGLFKTASHAASTSSLQSHKGAISGQGSLALA